MRASGRSGEIGDGSRLFVRKWRRLIVWGLALALFSTALASGCSTAPLSKDPKNLFAAAEPATVLVWADAAAKITVPGMSFNDSKIRDAMANSGDSYAGVVLGNPILYIDPDYTKPNTVDAKTGWSGSGFIADPNGYVVTNAHVAAPPDEQTKSELLNAGMADIITTEVKNVLGDTTVSQDTATALGKAFQQWSEHYAKFDQFNTSYSVRLGANIAGTLVVPKSVAANVVTHGEPIPGKDVAIIKIEGQNYPTIPIGDDTKSNVGDKLYIIGYPGVAMPGEGKNPLLGEQSLTEPTFTNGVLSAKKESVAGYQVIQTDASSYHGNSGGPVLNSDGQVIGILTFGSIDYQANQNVQGFNFIMPTTLINQFLGPSGAHPAQGEFSRLYTQGLTQEAAGQYKAALASFQQVDELSPSNPYVQRHVGQNAAAIAAGQDKSVDIMPFAVSAVAVLLVGIGAALVVITRRRKPAYASAEQVAMPSPSQTALLDASRVTVLPPVMQAETIVADDATVVSEGGGDVVALTVTVPSGTRHVVASLPAIVGRGPDCTVVLDDSEVSRHHAKISRSDGVLEVSDLDSRNGVRLNGDRTSVSPLRKGDRIQLGRSDLVVE